MKILSGPDGDGLITNAEVMQWLREKKKDEENEEKLPPPSFFVDISKELMSYFEKAPCANQTVSSVSALFQGLRKFKLSSPELLMIANIRPEGYANITPLIIDIHNRFDEDQVYEMLEVVKTTLEPRPRPEGEGEEQTVAQPNRVEREGDTTGSLVEETAEMSLDAPGDPGNTDAMET